MGDNTKKRYKLDRVGSSMEEYPERWAAVYAGRLGAHLGWERFRRCLDDPATVAALREALPADLMSDLLDAACTPDPDPPTMDRLANRLIEWREWRRRRRQGPDT